MIGLLFYGVIALWAVISVTLAIKIPGWLETKRYRPGFVFVLAPLIFFAPVADEIIAYPQMVSLCNKEAGPFQFADDIDAKSAYGRTVYHKQSESYVHLWPSTVVLLQTDEYYVDAITNRPILLRRGYTAVRGWLGIPAGSSGNRMTAILSHCRFQRDSYTNTGLPTRFRDLNIEVIATP